MRAIVLDKTFRYEPLRPEPLPGPDEALVRVTMAGICGTDLELENGYREFRGVPGHEFVGVVVRADAQREWIGHRVVGEINVACGACETCRIGFTTHCVKRTALGIHGLDGAFAEQVCIPIRNLHAVPDNVPDHHAVFTEPLAAACRIVQQVAFTPQTRVIVLGDGRLGLLCAQVLAVSTQSQVVAVGRHPRKLAILEARGIQTATSKEQVPAHADVVVDCTGRPQGFEDALSLVRPGGIVVLKSTCAGGKEGFDLNRIVVDEVQLIGSRCGPFDQALMMLAAGAIEVDAMIDSTYPLDRGVGAFERAATKGTLKVLFQVS